MRTEPVQSLDRVSRWLIATQSVVFVMTVNSVIIAALHYTISSGFSFGILLPFALVLLGLVLAHATSNLFNDYWDAKHGIDTSKDYFRPACMPHPLLSGMMSPRGLFSIGLAQIVGMAAIAFYLTLLRGLLVLLFAVLCLLFLTVYAGGPVSLKG